MNAWHNAFHSTEKVHMGQVHMGKRFFCAAMALFVAQGAVAATSVAPVARINATVNDAQRVELKGNTRPEANARNDRGVVADSLPMKHLQLLLQRSPEQEQALARQIDALHDPRSPDYHRWLDAAEFGRQYGVAPQDIARITAWLTSHDFTVGVVYPNALVIDFSGTAGAVRRAFHTEIHRVASKGAMHIANIGDPQIPAALAPAVRGIVSLHDFRPRSMSKRKPKYTVGNQQFVAPADLATIYNFNPVFAKGISGQGQTIALVEDTDVYSAQDWVAFRNAFGLSSYTSGNLVQLHPGPTNITNTASVPTSHGTSATQPPPDDQQQLRRPGHQQRGVRGDPRCRVGERGRAERDDRTRLLRRYVDFADLYVRRPHRDPEPAQCERAAAAGDQHELRRVRGLQRHRRERGVLGRIPAGGRRGRLGVRLFGRRRRGGL